MSEPLDYEAMVAAGEKAALDSEMESGWRYSEDAAVAKLRKIMDTRMDLIHADNAARRLSTIHKEPVVIDHDTARYLLNHIDRLLRVEKQNVVLRNAEFARNALLSQERLRRAVCPTCTVPLP